MLNIFDSPGSAEDTRGVSEEVIYDLVDACGEHFLASSIRADRRDITLALLGAVYRVDSGGVLELLMSNIRSRALDNSKMART